MTMVTILSPTEVHCNYRHHLGLDGILSKVNSLRSLFRLQRYEGLFPEGFTYAILLLNACVWLLDRHTAPRRFGTTKGGAA